MPILDSDSDSNNGSAPRIKPFKTSAEFPRWSKLVLNHLSGNGLLQAVVVADPDPVQSASDTATELDNVEASLTPAVKDKAVSAAKKLRRNAKAYSFIFARLQSS